VTGIDLTEEFVAAARALTRRLAMQDQVAFEHGSALAMPFAAASFDAATMFHVGMNIAAKPALFAEVRRMLKPGGIFGIYDQMRAGEGELEFPLPWASEPQASFVETPEAYKRWLTEAGFGIVWERSCAGDALAAFNRQTAGQPGTAAPPPLGVHVTMGRDAGRKIANLRKNLAAGILAPYEIVARATLR
jgi:SAM-dependent methyltransferase